MNLWIRRAYITGIALIIVYLPLTYDSLANTQNLLANSSFYYWFIQGVFIAAFILSSIFITSLGFVGQKKGHAVVALSCFFSATITIVDLCVLLFLLIFPASSQFAVDVAHPLDILQGIALVIVGTSMFQMRSDVGMVAIWATVIAVPLGISYMFEMSALISLLTIAFFVASLAILKSIAQDETPLLAFGNMRS